MFAKITSMKIDCILVPAANLSFHLLFSRHATFDSFVLDVSYMDEFEYNFKSRIL